MNTTTTQDKQVRFNMSLVKLCQLNLGYSRHKRVVVELPEKVAVEHFGSFEMRSRWWKKRAPLRRNSPVRRRCADTIVALHGGVWDVIWFWTTPTTQPTWCQWRPLIGWLFPAFWTGFSSTGCVVCRCHDSSLHACVKTRGNLCQQQTLTALGFKTTPRRNQCWAKRDEIKIEAAEKAKFTEHICKQWWQKSHTFQVDSWQTLICALAFGHICFMTT